MQPREAGLLPTLAASPPQVHGRPPVPIPAPPVAIGTLSKGCQTLRSREDVQKEMFDLSSPKEEKKFKDPRA